MRDHGPHSATRIGIEALKTDIPLTEENFFLFHDRFEMMEALRIEQRL